MIYLFFLVPLLLITFSVSFFYSDIIGIDEISLDEEDQIVRIVFFILFVASILLLKFLIANHKI